MVPTRQRLEAGDRAIVEPNDRLIQDRDFLTLERSPQIGLIVSRSDLRARIAGLNTSIRSPLLRLA